MAVLLRTDGRIEALKPLNGYAFTLQELHAAVGGYIECLPVPVDRFMVCNEEGKLQQLPVNPEATKILHATGWPTWDLVVGDVLIATLLELGEGDDAMDDDDGVA